MASSGVLTPAPPPFTLDAGTAFSLGVAFSLMPLAQGLAAMALPSSAPRKYYYLFLWHAYGELCQLSRRPVKCTQPPEAGEREIAQGGYSEYLMSAYTTQD
jgi:hypothetical protein